MFLPSSDTTIPSEAGLAAFCLSLNTPVVSAEGLPQAPARCAVAVHAGDYGGWELSVAVRSSEAGRWLVFGFQGDLSDATVDQTLETGLTFAEGMGFLFDEDWIANGGADARGKALAQWQELVGGTPPPPAPDVLGEPEELLLLDEPLADEPASAELLLDDLASATSKPTARPVAEPEPLPPAPEAPAKSAAPRPQKARPAAGKSRRRGPPAQPEEPAPVALSRFRAPQTDEAPPIPSATVDQDPADASSAGNTLGRISLVRRRVGAAVTEGGGRMSSLLRLLGSF